MKKNLLIFAFACITTTFFGGVANGQKNKTKSAPKSELSSLNGCWKRIAVITNGKPEANPLEQIRLFKEGFYTYIGQDSTHKWTRTFGGIYDISNNIYKETSRYCYIPSSVGITHWQEFKIWGDTVSFKLFNKTKWNLNK